MNRPAFLRLAVIGVCAAVVLAGCGRKGPLDPPPGAAGAPAVEEQGPQQRALMPRPLAEPAVEERPAVPGPQRRLPIDWLLN